MRNFLEEGETVVVTAPEDVDSGEFIKVGELYGVAPVAAASGGEVVLNLCGAYELPKTTSEAWTQGQKLFWNSSTKKFTTDASKTPVRAVAFAAADAADTLGNVLLGAGDSVKFVAGQSTTATASDTIATGLTKIAGVVASLNDAPSDDPSWVSADIGDQAGAPAAGSFLLKTWKNTSGTDPTPGAATTFSKKVNWIAFGY